MSNIRNVFVSHIHEDDAEVNNLKSLLRDKGMQVRDYSVTKDNPNSAKNIDYIRQKNLKPRLDASGTLAVILSQDMFDKNSEHVEWEVEQAYKAGKPVIGIWAHGEKGCDLPECMDVAATLVAWNAENIISAIEGDYSRQENWDGVARPYIPSKTAPC